MPDIESLLKEKRVFKPSREFAKQANWNKKTVREHRSLGAKNPERFWAKMAPRECQLVHALEEGAEVEGALRQVVRRRQAQRLLQLHRPAPGGRERLAPEQGRHHLGRRARRHAQCITYGELHREVCKFANVLKGLRA